MNDDKKEFIDITAEAEKQDFQIGTEVIREKTTSWLAGSIMIAFLIIISLPIWVPSSFDYVKYILPSITTLLGMAFGFYFSERRLN